YQRGFPAFQLPTPAEPGLRAANPGVIQLDVSMQRFTGNVDHGPPELVEEQTRGFVSSQAQLPLQPQGRSASCVGDHQVAGPEPDRERRSRQPFELADQPKPVGTWHGDVANHHGWTNASRWPTPLRRTPTQPRVHPPCGYQKLMPPTFGIDDLRLNECSGHVEDADPTCNL